MKHDSPTQSQPHLVSHNAADFALSAIQKTAIKRMNRYANRIFVFHAPTDPRGEPLSWKVAASRLDLALDALKPEITPEQFASISRVEVEKDSQAIIISKE